MGVLMSMPIGMDMDIPQHVLRCRASECAVVLVFHFSSMVLFLKFDMQQKNPLAAGYRFLAPCLTWRQYAATHHGASIVERMLIVSGGVVNTAVSLRELST